MKIGTKAKNMVATLAVTVSIVGASFSAEGALLKSYDFDTGLSDTLGNGVDLTASGGSVAGGLYTFGVNQGLRLTSALPSTTDYAIEMRFQVSDSTAGYNKLIDFSDLGLDFGLYVLSGAIKFYTVSGSLGSVALNTDTTVGLVRSGAGTISIYQDGSPLGSVSDGGQAVPGTNVLNFFEDDFQTSQSEAFAGSVDFIRIHDDASTFGQIPPTSEVPLPGAIGFGLASLALLGMKARRR